MRKGPSLEKPTVRAVGYIRVSTTGQAEEGASLAEQAKRIKKLCTERDWRLVEIYDEGALTGKKNIDGPEMVRLRSDALRGLFNCVLYLEQKRLGRKTINWLQLQEEFKQIKVKLIDVGNPDERNTPSTRMTNTIKAAVAEQEADYARQRMLQRWRSKAEEGNFNFGQRVPYGLCWNDDGKLEHDPDKVKVWQLIKALRLNRGWSYGQIARLLNDEATAQDRKEARGLLTQFSVSLPVPKKYSKDGWRDGTISSMCRDEARVTGQLEMDVPNEDDDGEPYYYRFTFSPLTTRREFNQLAAQAKQNRTRQPRPVGTGAMLSGLCVCGRCGAPMNVTGYRHKDKAYAYYGCRRRVRRPKPGEERCTLPLVPQRLLERHVVQAIMAVLGDDEKFEGAVAAATGGADKHAALANLRTKEGLIVKRLADLKRRHNRLLDAIAAAGLGPKAGGTKLREVVTATDRTEAELEAVRREQAALETVVAQSEKVCDSRRGWFRRMKRWGKLTKAERSGMIRTVVAPQEGGHIVVDAWRWRGDENPDDPPGMGGKGLDVQVSIHWQLQIAGGSINEMAVLGGAVAVPCTCNPLQQG